HPSPEPCPREGPRRGRPSPRQVRLEADLPPPALISSAARGPRRPQARSTSAPASVSFFLISSASALLTPSLTLPPASTRSLASFRPRPVIARTSLITLILL